MKSLTIVTENWMTIEYDNFLLIKVEEVEDDENPDCSKWILAGVLSEEGDFIAICIEETEEIIIEQYSKLLYALDSNKPLVDYRKPRVSAIDIVKNSRHNPKSDLN